MIRRLGGGRRGEGYLVWDERLGTAAAAKVARPLLAGDGRSAARLEREASVLRDLRHPCIMRVLDVALDPPHPHILVAYADGPSLAQLVKRGGPLPWERVAALGLQIGGALQYLAAGQRVHYDVKPANIVMSAPPVLIDFGASRTFEKADRPRTERSSRYKAPEQCEPGARGTEGAPVDVWGLGFSMYEALAGRPPFPRHETGAVATQISHEPFSLPDRLPAPLVEVVLGCLRKHPDERLTGARVVEGLWPLMASALDGPPAASSYAGAAQPGAPSAARSM